MIFDIRGERTKQKKKTVDLVEFKEEFAVLKKNVEELMPMEPDGYFRNSLQSMIEWTTAELNKVPPASPLLAFEQVQGILNNEAHFGSLLSTSEGMEKELIRDLKERINRMHAMCRNTEWPKPKK